MYARQFVTVVVTTLHELYLTTPVTLFNGLAG